MRTLKSLAICVLLPLGASNAWADDVSKVMCEQFSIHGAARTVYTTESFPSDFSPSHHAPRNIPIDVSLPDSKVSYIHFPIVEAGKYIIYANNPDRLAAIKLKDGKSLSVSQLPAPSACAELLKGGLSVQIKDEHISGPTPIAIELDKGAPILLRLIVSRDPIN